MKLFLDSDYKKLYENKPYYDDWVRPDSPGYKKILLEDLEWKLPHLQEIIPFNYSARTVVEIGCSIGHIIGNLKINGTNEFERFGFDVNSKHIEFGRKLYPYVKFYDHSAFDGEKRFDLLILCDILEHIQNDLEFLKSCRAMTDCLLVNIPLEKCFMARHRELGPETCDGHLRVYNLNSAEQLLLNAGFKIVSLNVVSYLGTYISQKIFNADGKNHPLGQLDFLSRFLLFHFPSIMRWYSGGNLFAFCE